MSGLGVSMSLGMGILKETGLEEDRKIELSMDEIAQKFGVAVKDLKIKKD